MSIVAGVGVGLVFMFLSFGVVDELTGPTRPTWLRIFGWVSAGTVFALGVFTLAASLTVLVAFT